MSRAKEHLSYGEDVKPWSNEQLDDYYRGHGFVVQRNDIVDSGIPTREQFDVMLEAPGQN